MNELRKGTRIVERFGYGEGRGCINEIKAVCVAADGDGNEVTLYCFYPNGEHNPPKWATEKYIRRNYWVVTEEEWESCERRTGRTV
jgi:hypothetical protein